MNSLSEYFRKVFDLDNDGKVTVREFFSAMLPNHAVGISLIVVDILALVAEYRVWDVGMKITNDPYKAFGFVLVSAVPFYLAQILWLYPRATTAQQGIAVAMLGFSLFTSAQFGLADLSQSYDVARLVRIVIWLTIAYIVALLVYVLIDKSFKLYRATVKAKDDANFQREMNEQMDQVLDDMEKSLARRKALMDKYGPDAVNDYMDLMDRDKKKKGKNQNNNRPLPPPPPPSRQPAPEPNPQPPPPHQG